MPTNVSGPCDSSVIIVAKSIRRSLGDDWVAGKINDVLFADVVATSTAVTSTPARSAKIASLADLLARLEGEEIPVAVAMLTGTPRQGRIGIGWRTVVAVDVSPAETPSLTILEVDDAISRLAVTTGTGSAASRTNLLVEVLQRATKDEADFLRRLFT